MLNELKKKKTVFDSFKPFSEEFKITYNNLNLLDFAYMNLKLDGSNLTREGVNEISRGGMIDHVPLKDHQEIEHHKNLLKVYWDMLEMDMELDEKQLVRIYSVITGQDVQNFRSSGTMLYHLDYMPPHSNEIPAALRNVFVRVFNTDFENDYIKKAVFIHNKIIEVYPFEEKSETLARAAMEYELIRNGMPVIPFELTESEYNLLLSEYLKTGVSDALYDNILEAGIKKMDILLNVLREEDMNKT